VKESKAFYKYVNVETLMAWYLLVSFGKSQKRALNTKGNNFSNF